MVLSCVCGKEAFIIEYVGHLTDMGFKSSCGLLEQPENVSYLTECEKYIYTLHY